MANVPFALQLYTVRDHMAKDPVSTLKRVKGIGYDHVEAAGFGGVGAAEFKSMLDGCGLSLTSAHVGLEALEKDANAVAADMHTLGVGYAVVPWMGAGDRAGWDKVIQALDRGGATLRAEGITLCYHNHAHEFEKLDGEPILDYIFAHTDPDHVQAELDTYWIKFGKADPVEYIQKYVGRCPLLHVKDMSAEESRTFAEVGTGILDWPAIFAAARQSGVQWYIVEQDTCPIDSIESAATSARYMKTL